MKTNLYVEPQKSRLKALALASQGDFSALEAIAEPKSVAPLVAALTAALSNLSDEDRILFGVYSSICQQALLLKFITGSESDPI